MSGAGSPTRCPEASRAGRSPERAGLRAFLLAGALGIASPAVAAAQNLGQPSDAAALAAQGAVFYQREGCPICHRIGGAGGIAGPALDGVAARHPDPAWYVSFLRDPASVKKDAPMPPFGHLPEHQLRALAAYLLTIK